ncbi:MAG: hypothetical protein JOZ32_08325 [Bryobacterales bacterium]|nr:hypothetical protein [Bryobacterales bacterium]
MPKNDDGEFELVLGNRQLISVFLIVVVLLGVFFSMGYIVGRNSPAGAVETARNVKPAPDPAVSSADGSNPAPADQSSADTAPASTTDPTPSSSPPENANSARQTRASSAAIKPKPSPVSGSAAPSAAVNSEGASQSGQPSAGQYWQVVATVRPDAEIIAEALGKRGFRTLIAPAPKDGIFRVLVGPLADASIQAQVRTNLESAGFKNPIMRKY